MSNTQQPEALRLINNRQYAHLISWQANACAELRRLHKREKVLVEALQAIMFRIEKDCVPGAEWAIVEQELARAALANTQPAPSQQAEPIYYCKHCADSMTGGKLEDALNAYYTHPAQQQALTEHELRDVFTKYQRESYEAHGIDTQGMAMMGDSLFYEILGYVKAALAAHGIKEQS